MSPPGREANAGPPPPPPPRSGTAYRRGGAAGALRGAGRDGGPSCEAVCVSAQRVGGGAASDGARCSSPPSSKASCTRRGVRSRDASDDALSAACRGGESEKKEAGGVEGDAGAEAQRSTPEQKGVGTTSDRSSGGGGAKVNSTSGGGGGGGGGERGGKGGRASPAPPPLPAAPPPADATESERVSPPHASGESDIEPGGEQWSAGGARTERSKGARSASVSSHDGARCAEPPPPPHAAAASARCSGDCASAVRGGDGARAVAREDACGSQPPAEEPPDRPSAAALRASGGNGERWRGGAAGRGEEGGVWGV